MQIKADSEITVCLVSQECTTLLLNQLDQQYRIVEEDCKLYRQALDHLNEEAVDDKEETELHQELEKVKPKFPKA